MLLVNLSKNVFTTLLNLSYGTFCIKKVVNCFRKIYHLRFMTRSLIDVLMETSERHHLCDNIFQHLFSIFSRIRKKKWHKGGAIRDSLQLGLDTLITLKYCCYCWRSACYFVRVSGLLHNKFPASVIYSCFLPCKVEAGNKAFINLEELRRQPRVYDLHLFLKCHSSTGVFQTFC